MPIRILLIVILSGFLLNNSVSQNKLGFIKESPKIFDLNHQILIGSISGQRSEKFNHKISIHYLSAVTFKRYELGLGVGFENENYFHLLPAYIHFSHNIWNKENSPQPFINAGLAFNTEKDIALSNSIPGILLSGGMKHDIRIGRKSFLQLKLGYRYQETSTLRLQPSFGSPAPPPSETLVKHKMHRINAQIGIKF